MNLICCFLRWALLLLCASQKFRGIQAKRKDFLLIFFLSPFALKVFIVKGKKSQEKQMSSNVELLST